jgi:hypothetical protein
VSVQREEIFNRMKGETADPGDSAEDAEERSDD